MRGFSIILLPTPNEKNMKLNVVPKSVMIAPLSQCEKLKNCGNSDIFGDSLEGDMRDSSSTRKKKYRII